MRSHPILDCFDANLSAAGAQQVTEQVSRAFDSDFTPDQHGVCGNTVQRTLELTNIAGDAMRQKLQNLVWNPHLHLFSLGLQNPETQFIVGRMDIRHHAPAKPRPQPLFHPLKISWRFVGRNNNLTPTFDQSVEGVEKLILR